VKLALDKTELKIFLKLGLPGIFSMSDWWFWEYTCFMAGNIGVEELAAHTIAYNVIVLIFLTILR